MINKKVIILVLCANTDVYVEFENTIKKTWYNLKNEDVEIIFYKSGNICEFVEPDLILPCGDDWYSIGLKTLLAFDWVSKNYNYEYIYRSNMGAYVDPIKILNFLKDKPKNGFYDGITGVDNFYTGKPIEFASGSGYFLSKDLVNLVLDNKDIWSHRIVDDVALGELLNKFNISPNKTGIRLNLCDDEKFYQIGDKKVDLIPEEYIYHIRLRSDNRYIDIDRMKKIYKNDKSYIR